MSVLEDVARAYARDSASAPAARTRRPSLKMTSTLMLAPAASATFVCFFLFVAWTFYISLTRSRLLPDYGFAGWGQYRRLFANAHWWAAAENLILYAVSVVAGCVVLGYLLAILIDRGVRWQPLYRAIFLLPLSISFVVTGLIWRWLLDPGLGIQQAVQHIGWESFAFDWLVRSDRAIYTIAIASIWQHVGTTTVLLLAGMHGLDPNVWKSAQVDGIRTWRVYVHVIAPMLRTTFVTVLVLLFCMSVKTFDLVVTLTSGGPGFSSDLPAHFVVELTQRQELGMAAAGACLLLCSAAAATVPYLYIESRKRQLA
jgi:glucose/mannose transport system permease protein